MIETATEKKKKNEDKGKRKSDLCFFYVIMCKCDILFHLIKMYSSFKNHFIENAWKILHVVGWCSYRKYVCFAFVLKKSISGQ
jgi:hypothetical protein